MFGLMFSVSKVHISQLETSFSGYLKCLLAENQRGFGDMRLKIETNLKIEVRRAME
jgi:hypothetical protein